MTRIMSNGQTIAEARRAFVERVVFDTLKKNYAGVTASDLVRAVENHVGAHVFLAGIRTTYKYTLVERAARNMGARLVWQLHHTK